MTVIDAALVGKAMSYEEHVADIDRLVAEGRTSGPQQSEALASYTRLNFQRMNRIHGSVELGEEALAAARSARPTLWLVLTEAWCGDAANSVPVIARLAEASAGRISLGLLYRDENPGLMDRYLTDGARSIPILIDLDPSTFEERGRWGPRPAPVQKIMMDHLAAPEPGRDIYRDVQLWYNQDRSRTLLSELTELLTP